MARSKRARRADTPRVSLISLGCAKNQVDSENLLGGIAQNEFILCPDPADADVVVLNTCGFIQQARDECDQVLGELIRLKRGKRGRPGRIVVVGCWVEREGQDLAARYPDVDLWTGLLTPERIAGLTAWIAGRTDGSSFDGPSHVAPGYEGDRPRIGLAHVAYLRISDGCVNNCAYCTIPAIRGTLRSKSIEHVIREGRCFAEQGVSELILVAQDLADFGRDRGGKSELPELLERLDREVDIPWIRLMYLHPAHIDDKLLDTLAARKSILHYLDVPLQHITDSVLSAMNRHVTRSDCERLIDALRVLWSDLVLRTTLIVGFPGETDSDFAELEAFVRSQRFEHLGCFEYCSEKGTPAASLRPVVREDLIAERRQRLMQLQQGIVFARNNALVGRPMRAIIDAPGDASGRHTGRTWGDAPEVDGIILLDAAGRELRPGRIVTAEVTESDGYDLVGRVNPS